MTKANNTRERIIERARHLLQNRGFDGFSYRDISSHLGVRNAAIHYHFPSKSDLGLTLMETQIEAVRERIAEARRREVPIPTQLEAYFTEAEREVQNACCMCAMGAMSVAWDGMTEAMRSALRRFDILLTAWLSETLEQGREQGNVHFDGAAADKAMQISAAMQGARLLTRMHGRQAVQQVADQFRRELFVGKPLA